MRLIKLRRGGEVLRYHRTPTARQQSVAEHSWNVLTIILEVWPDASRDLILAALYHDVPEGEVGDLPYTAKKRFPGLQKEIKIAEVEVAEDLGISYHFRLSEEDLWKLKFADMLEVLLYSGEQDNFRYSEFLVNAHRELEKMFEKETPNTEYQEPALHLFVNLQIKGVRG